jgi:hypothetical protein
MKINLFRVRKWIGFAIAGIFPVVFFIYIILTIGDLLLAVVGVFIGMILSAVIGSLLIRHPMLEMLEGKGLLTFTIDSTGTIENFICGVNPPYIKGFFRGKEINTTFDRDMVGYLHVPQHGKLCQAVEIDENGNRIGECTVLKMPKAEDKPEHLFSFSSFPVFIFNKNLGIFLSKEVLATNEKDTMIKHVILYLLRKTEDLTNSIRDFARHVVEQTRPRKWLSIRNKWLWIILIVIAVVAILIMLGPSIMEAIGSAGESSPFPSAKQIPFIKSWLL